MVRIRASVILPTYNEAGNIVNLVKEIRKELSKKRIAAEIIVVDDNSPDKTGLLAQKYFSRTPGVRVIIRRKERGLATAIRRGIEASVGEVVVVMDSDFNHEPKLVPRLISKCGKYDFAVGSRYIGGGGMANKKREFLSKMYNMLLIRPILGSPVHDNLSGFFAMRYERLNKLNFNKIFYGYGEYFMRLIYFSRRQGDKFVELPSFYQERTYGETKSKFLKMAYEYLLAAVFLRIGKR